jgi:hypothetical protein
VGACIVEAEQGGDEQYASASAQESITVGPKPQGIVFTSAGPTPALAGSTYTVTATGGGSGNEVVFTIDSSSTPGACTISGSLVKFVAAGTCLIDADQAGNAEWAPALQVRQPIAITTPPPIVTVVPGPGPKAPPPPSPGPTGNSNFTAGKSAFEPKTGRVIFYETITDPGRFKWVLTVPNGKFGAFASAKKKCNAGLVRLRGRCRPSRVIFATGSAPVPAGLVIFKLRPSPNALKALKNALKQRRGLLVTATFTFQSSRGGSPVTHTQTLRVKLKK